MSYTKQTSKTILPTFTVAGFDVVYCRVSTDEQTGNTSLPDQETRCRDYLERLGLDNVLVFKEDFSGFEQSRPELNKILDLMRQGKVRSFIALRVDRICRKIGILEALREQYFKPLGIEVHTLDLMRWQWTAAHESIQDNLCLMGSFWGKILVEILWNGKRRHILDGNPMTAGKPPLGLKEVIEFDSRGKRIGAHFEFDPVESAIVLRIFSEYIDNGLSLVGLADKLNTDKVPTYTELRDLQPLAQYQKKISRSGNKWRTSTIRQILRETAYDGRWYWGKTKSVKVMGNDGLPVIGANGKVKTKKLQANKDKLILVEVEPLIPHDMWQAVQKKLDRNREEKRGRQPKYEYLLSKRIRCGECSYAMTVQAVKDGRYLYYHCLSVNKKLYGEQSCTAGYVPAKLVDGIAWGWLYKLLKDKDELRTRIKNYQDEVDKIIFATQDRLKHVDKSLEKKHAIQSAMLNNLFKLPEIAQAKTLTMINQIEEEIKEYNQEREEIMEVVDEAEQTLDTVGAYLGIFGEPGEVLGDDFNSKVLEEDLPDTYEEKLKYIEDFDLRVTILSDNRMRVSCKIGSEVLSLLGFTSLGNEQKSQKFLISFADVLRLDFGTLAQFQQVEVAA